MSTTWIEFLQSQGATFNSASGDIEFPATDNTQLQLMPLSDHCLLSMQGPDSENFLQGQLTCDIRQLSPGKSILGSNCSPKGEVISCFRLLMKETGNLFIRLPSGGKEQAQTNLNKYIVFSKAELKDASEDYAGIGLSGDNAATLIAELFGEAPTQSGDQSIKNDTLVVRVPGQTPRFEIWAPVKEAEGLWLQIGEKATATSSSEWRRQEIEAGLAMLDSESVEQYLPQMLNLQAVEGVSFEKGCYIGQEVVTRLQYRGKLKKILCRAKVDASVQPLPGMSLHTANRKGVGKVICAAPTADGYELQAVIAKKAADSETLHLEQQDGPVIELLALPYELDKELFER